MGDTHRNLEFSKFIVLQFPKAKSVLVVADGKGELAKILAFKGFQVHIIEAKPRWSKKVKGVQYSKGWFTADTVIEDDIVVGMHLDEATGEVLLAAKNQMKPFAIVPCCAVGKYSDRMKKNSYEEWIKKLIGIFNCQQFTLKIKGRNIVLYQKEW